MHIKKTAYMSRYEGNCRNRTEITDSCERRDNRIRFVRGIAYRWVGITAPDTTFYGLNCP